ncbi:ABC transporter permease, partial [Caldalkalibacillus mannanilyticus]|uniref:ABC transporter permease n=1 Tax=Caldalkalibacillus mannanilyticus TaxID=1418 RepID=UPI0004689100
MKITVENIWKQRSQDYFQESIGYWKLIGSSGLLGSTIILFILGVIYYPDFLEWLPQAFPVSFVLAIFLGWFITRASFRTLLQEADILFLTPVEKNMNLYFRQAVVYNTAIQITGLVLILMIFSPLYANKISDTESLWLFFLLPVLLKGWNLQSAWQTHRLQDGRKRNIHAVCRFSFHTLFLYWFFTGGSMGWLL